MALPRVIRRVVIHQGRVIRVVQEALLLKRQSFVRETIIRKKWPEVA